MILLDTCALLWLTGDQARLSERAKTRLQEESNGVYVSSITVFEIGLLVKKGRIRFALPLREWFQTALDVYGLQEWPIDSKTALLATELPPIHNDPADRFLIAAAIVHRMELLTPDPCIGQYPDVRVVW